MGERDKSDAVKQKWIITPGLKDFFHSFMQTCEANMSEDQSLLSKRPLLIIGNSGTGKSMFIEAYKQTFIRHFPKSLNKIRRINCAALSEELIESELFGHEKGSFTGAGIKKIGLLEEADGGLVILDEIGELAEYVQAKLLVFIEDGEFRRVGSNKIQTTNVKILGTTNKTKDHFRPDFWFRFYPLFVPALHERRLDILVHIFLLSKHYYNLLNPTQALRLLAYNWPGNVRELERFIVSMDVENRFHQSTPIKVDQKPNRQANDWENRLRFYDDLDARLTDLHNDEHTKLGSRLITNGYDLASLNKTLGGYGVALPCKLSCIPRNDFFERFTIETNVASGKERAEHLHALKPLSPKEQNLYNFFKRNPTKRNAYTLALRGYLPLLSRTFKKKDFVELTEYSQLKNFYTASPLKHYKAVKFGLNVFSKLFFQDVAANETLLSMERFTETRNYDVPQPIPGLIDRLHKRHLLIPLYEAMLGRKLQRNPISEKQPYGLMIITKLKEQNRDAFDTFFSKFEGNNTKDKPNTDHGVPAENLFQGTEHELLHAYYTYLVKSSKNIADAARRAGDKDPTFRKKLDRFKIKKA